MPTYEYQCQSCFHQLEAFQKMSDAPLTHCPQCGKETLQKQVSASAFSLKGSGWYVTDFRDKSAKKTESTPTTTPEKNTETTTKTETKEVKSESTPVETKPKSSTGDVS